MAGTGSNTFGPDLTTTRGMIVTILYSLEGTPAVSTASGFTDVAPGAYYANAVTWAAGNGIVAGYGGGLFGPRRHHHTRTAGDDPVPLCPVQGL